MSYLLQKSISREQSYCYLSSLQAWQHGIQAIFYHGVPFSARNNYQAALQHVGLIETIFSQRGVSGPFEILECGSPHGMLSKFILDILKDKHPIIYKNVIVTISDFSHASTQLFEQSQFVKPHLGVLQFVSHFSDQKASDTYDYIFYNYNYCCFPSRHLEISQDGIYEWEVETYLNDGVECVCFDFQSDLGTYFKSLSIDELICAFQQDPAGFIRDYSAGLAPFIEEKFSKKLIKDPDFLTYLSSFRSVFTDGDRFNFSVEAIDHLKSIVQKLKPWGALLFSDCTFKAGRQNRAVVPVDALVTYQENLIYFPIHFKSLLSALPDSVGSSFVHYDAESLVDCFVCHDLYSDVYQSVFKQSFRPDPLKKIRKALSDMGQTTDESQLMSIYDSFDESMRKDYYLTQFALQRALRHQWHSFARDLSVYFYDLFKEFAFDHFRVIGSLPSNGCSFDSLLEGCLMKSVELCPEDLGLVLSYVQLLIQSGDREQAIDCIEKALFLNRIFYSKEVAVDPILLEVMRFLSFLYRLEQNSDKEEPLQVILDCFEGKSDLNMISV